MLNSDMNTLYWARMVERYTKEEFRLKIFIAFATSATVGGWAIWDSLPWLYRISSMAATGASIYLPLRNHTKLIEEMAQIRRSWLEMLLTYELIWNKGISGGFVVALDKDFEKTRKKQDAVTHKESKLPRDPKLLRQCQVEVKHRRKLK